MRIALHFPFDRLSSVNYYCIVRGIMRMRDSGSISIKEKIQIVSEVIAGEKIQLVARKHREPALCLLLD